MNKKIMIGAIALVGISTLIVQQASAASMMGRGKHGGPENMNRSRTYTGMHLGSGRDEMRSGLKLGSGRREHFGSGFHFGSGDMMWSGERKDFLGTGIKLNPEKKIGTTQKASTIKKSSKASKKVIKKKSKKSKK